MLANAADSAARSAIRPTNGVNGDGGRVATAIGPADAHRIGTQLSRDGSQRAAIIHLQFAQQRGNMTLDGTDGDGQPSADLSVGQALAERGQDLGLSGGDTHLGESSLPDHTPIVLATRE